MALNLSDRFRRGELGEVLFPVLLWFVATFFLLGDIGKYNDDWYYVQRNAATGEIQSLVLERYVHFWRPLYRVVVPSLMTLLSEHDWLHHFILACAHGVVGVLLWKILRELRATRIGAAIGVVWFMVWPAHFEAILWLCASPTLLSAAVVLTTWLLTMRFASGRLGRYGWPVMMVGVPLLFFVSACLNEQASCGVTVLPFLYMAARASEEKLGRSFMRAVVPAAASFLVLCLYVVLHVKLRFKMPALEHDAVMIPLAGLPEKMMWVNRWVVGQVASGEYLSRLLSAGREAIAAYPVRSVVLGAALLTSLPWWVKSVSRTSDEVSTRSLWVIAAGGVMYAGALAPIAGFNYWYVPRITYAPLIGVAMMIAGVISLLGPQQRARGRWVRVVLASFMGVVFIGGAVMMAGIQRGYQVRVQQDEDELRQLKELVPSPAQGTVFAPLAIGPSVVSRGGKGRYEAYFCSSLSSWWSSRWVVQHAYKRNDLLCGYTLNGQGAFINAWPDRALVRDVGEVPWALIVPFVIDDHGKVTLVTDIRVAGVVVEMPQAVEAAKERELPRVEVALPW